MRTLCIKLSLARLSTLFVLIGLTSCVSHVPITKSRWTEAGVAELYPEVEVVECGSDDRTCRPYLTVRLRRAQVFKEQNRVEGYRREYESPVPGLVFEATTFVVQVGAEFTIAVVSGTAGVLDGLLGMRLGELLSSDGDDAPWLDTGEERVDVSGVGRGYRVTVHVDGGPEALLTTDRHGCVHVDLLAAALVMGPEGGDVRVEAAGMDGYVIHRLEPQDCLAVFQSASLSHRAGFWGGRGALDSLRTMSDVYGLYSDARSLQAVIDEYSQGRTFSTSSKNSRWNGITIVKRGRVLKNLLRLGSFFLKFNPVGFVASIFLDLAIEGGFYLMEQLVVTANEEEVEEPSLWPGQEGLAMSDLQLE